MKKAFAYILGITAVSLAAIAAFYSVYGLSKLFIGASFAVVLLAGVLEFSKIIIVSFLHQFWRKVFWAMKAYLLFAVISLMVITSAGIYGFLSSAYSKTSVELERLDGEISLIDKKIEIFKDEMGSYTNQLNEKEKIIDTKRNSLESFNKINETLSRDTTIRNRWLRKSQIDENLKHINKENSDIDILSKEKNVINIKMSSINDSIAYYEIKKTELNHRDLVGEVGPLKYIAKATGKSIDSVVNWLMMLFIFLIDPLSILLVISTNRLVYLINEEKRQKADDSAVSLQETLVEPKMQETTVEPEKDVAPIKKTEYVSKENGEFVKVGDGGTQKNENVEKTIVNTNKDKMLNGVFTAETASNQIYAVENDYQYLLKIFYNDGGLSVGDVLPKYEDLKPLIKNTIPEKVVHDFITVCNLLKIFKSKGGETVILKSFENAKGVLGNL